MNDKTLKNIEELELKYLKKYYHFLKFAEDEMFYGFKTKEAIKDDWFGLYGDENGKGISDFAVGAERIVYSLLNGKGIGQPNSSPVGADLFFEVEDAYIHIDLKTVQKDNIGDFTTSIFVGRNQNSYKGNMIVRGEVRAYEPALPTFYNKNKENQKICLSYFITILYDRKNLDILVITIDCMPNGELESHYKERVLKAGKNLDKTRFNIKEVNKFELLDGKPSRIKVIYFDEKMDEDTKNKLTIFEQIYKDNTLN
ncbi:hypothetical protein QJU43_00685 [Pasteurella atlantica]|uniref:Uncharacterized protein n=2 Tax=Pasteurellaceae TaxID=712 RepID=A0ACC6HLX8_9PAST|nr:hypothetical protein [Pasteurella atlantica]MDP8032750.1 hypothetical protein [Pasteurella atlantica]MDP8034744.1 hypothetical protein [Pasteurella atlantica]MDP8036694.1 hypothetical protein [Pasteurella atlantica]MDP8046984.1 hypothetical protein [Pasteurella atlantica]MDP8048937.1 hypothetical protein [Pasteurella atlantica]